MGELGDFLFELFDFGALLADHDAGARGVNIDLRLVRRPLDFDFRNARVIEPGLQKFLDAKIFMQQLGVIMAREPFGVPRLDDAETKNLWMRFLTHQAVNSSSAASSSTMVTWLSRLRTRVARPCARDVKRFHMPASSTLACLTNKTIDVDALGILGVGHRRAHRLGDDSRGALGNKLQNVQRLLDALAANLIDDQSHLSRRDSDKFCDRACFHIQAR